MKSQVGRGAADDERLDANVAQRDDSRSAGAERRRRWSIRLANRDSPRMVAGRTRYLPRGRRTLAVASMLAGAVFSAVLYFGYVGPWLLP